MRVLSPILGAGAVVVCPLCWAGSAAFLTYLGLGALIPVWQGLVFLFLALGLIGFILDYRFHHNIYPSLLLIAGSIILYLGRYVYGGERFGGWHIWGVGAIIIIVSVLYNKRLFQPQQ
jgi:drug/metabolite transporter (DMT)-like permease